MRHPMIDLARMCGLQARLLLNDGLKTEALELAVRALTLMWLADEAPRKPIPVRVNPNR